jgi:hypothetical protein
MGLGESVVVFPAVCGLLGSAYLLSRAAMRKIPPDDGPARFTRYYEELLGFNGILICCLGLVLVAGPHVESSWLALAVILAVNLIMQPVALLACWMGLRAIGLGLCGCISYGGRRVPVAELADLSASGRRGRLLYCVCKGMFFVLFFGAWLSVVCGWPLLQLAFALPPDLPN